MSKYTGASGSVPYTEKNAYNQTRNGETLKHEGPAPYTGKGNAKKGGGICEATRPTKQR